MGFKEANLFLGIFNLLPFFSLDGGNIMKNLKVIKTQEDYLI